MAKSKRGLDPLGMHQLRRFVHKNENNGNHEESGDSFVSYANPMDMIPMPDLPSKDRRPQEESPFWLHEMFRIDVKLQDNRDA